MNKPEIKEAIIVEGRYDKNTLSQIVDANIIETNGFSVFNDSELRNYIKKTAEETGIIILTDSDSSGFVIRNEIKSFVDNSLIKEAFIPQIEGKEKRKDEPSKEGLLGVEGMTRDVILKALKNAGFSSEKSSEENKLTAYDLYELGLTGKENSEAARRALLERLDLPSFISVKELISYINRNYSRDDFIEKFKEGEI